jgi:hypothetical protein
MTSILKVSEIQDPTNSNSALTIDSSGRVTHPQIPFVNVSFGGGGSGSYQSHSAGAVVAFNTAYDGDASLYNTSTYKFTCPIAGLYMSTFHLLTQSQTNIKIHFYKNSTMLTRSIFGSRDASATHIISCASGDELYLITEDAESFYNASGDGNRYSWGAYTLIG